LVSVNLLGIGAVRATNREGVTVKATTNEKLYLMCVLEMLQNWGVAINSRSPLVAMVTSDFANAIHHRPQPSIFSGGFVYGVFFSTFSSKETARRYFEKQT